MVKNLLVLVSSFAALKGMTDVSTYEFSKKFSHFPTIYLKVNNDLKQTQTLLIYSDIADTAETTVLKSGYGVKFALKAKNKFGISLNRNTVVEEFATTKLTTKKTNYALVIFINNSIFYGVPFSTELLIDQVEYPILFLSSFNKKRKGESVCSIPFNI